MSTEPSIPIDIETKNRYDRQLHALGERSLHSLFQTSVLISGFDGTGAEILKNLLLSGIYRIGVHDTTSITWDDFSTHFYLRENDIIPKPDGSIRTRAEATLDRFRPLNPLNQLQSYNSELSREIISNYSTVILVNQSEQDIQTISLLTRELQKQLIVVNAVGVFMRVFVDAGASYQILDLKNAPEVVIPIEDIDNGTISMVWFDKLYAGKLQEDDLITFENVNGDTPEPKLNGKGPFQIRPPKHGQRALLPASVWIDVDTKGMGVLTGGAMKTTPIQRKISHSPFKIAMEHPDFVLFNVNDFDQRTKTIHCCFSALDSFCQQENRLPKPYNEEDATRFVPLTKAVFSRTFPGSPDEDFKEDVARLFSKTAQSRFCGVTSVAGAIASQEVIKLATRTGLPITQFLCLDHIDLIPSPHPSEEDVVGVGGRYDGQVKLFGQTMQSRLLDVHCFLVGAGALGCEALKAIALMGLCCGEKGMLTVTDMDSIELSNLSRQFLFTDADVSKPKSECALAAAVRMNPSLKGKAYTKKVADESGDEGYSRENDAFSFDFWAAQDFVIAALDNVEARVFVNAQCLRFGKAMFECGTEASLLSVTSVVPHVTHGYEPPPKRADTDVEVPSCTLKQHPTAIEHCIQFAKDKMDNLFKDSVLLLETFKASPVPTIRTLCSTEVADVTLADQLLTLLSLMEGGETWNFDNCVEWARWLFEDMFVNRINELMRHHPLGSKDEHDKDYWAKKTVPQTLVFSPDNDEHVSFVECAAFLRATSLGVVVPSDYPAAVRQLVHTPLPTRTHTKREEAIATVKTLDEATLTAVAQHVFTPLEFEKDVDSNRQIDFLFFFSNLRAQNYKISQQSRLRIKQLSTQLIPAMETTTAMAQGLVMIEVGKYMSGKTGELDFRSWNVHLTSNRFNRSYAQRASRPPYSQLDEWEGHQIRFTHTPTVAEVVAMIESSFDCTVLKLSCAGKVDILDAQAADGETSALLTDALKPVTDHLSSPIVLDFEGRAKVGEEMMTVMVKVFVTE